MNPEAQRRSAPPDAQGAGPSPDAAGSGRRPGPLSTLREALARALWRLRGVDLHPTARFSPSVEFDRTHPEGVHVGAHSYIAFGARVLSRDDVMGARRDTRIGRDCYLGPRALILPGAEIGDGAVVGAGAVVSGAVAPGTMVGGNPARVLREGIGAGRYGGLDGLDATESAAAERGLP